MLETVVARARTNINANYNYLSFNLYYPVKNVDIGKNELLAK
jgi:hypothetical protein